MAKLSGIENIPGKVGKKKTGKPAKKRHAVLANKRVPRKRG